MVFRELLASDEFQQDLLHQPFNSLDEFANFVIQELNQYLSWFFKAPEGTNFFPQEGNFLREHIPLILGEYLPSEAVMGKGNRGFVSTEGIADGKGEEMVLSPTPQTRQIFFPPFFGEQEKANNSRGESLVEEDEAPAKRVMVELAAVQSQPLPPLPQTALHSQPFLPLLPPLNLYQPSLLSLNLSQAAPTCEETFDETRMRRSSSDPESGRRSSGARRQRHLTG